MDCYLCTGTMSEELVTVTRYREGSYYLIENVPAMVCDQCGEKWFNMKTVVKMDNLMNKPIEPNEKHITVPVRKYA